MIAFSSFIEKHSTKNIDSWIKKILDQYEIEDSSYTILTDSGANMVSLKNEHPLVVCFSHRLHTTIATAFNKTKETNEELSKLNKCMTDIITFVKRSSNIKENYGIVLKEGGTTRRGDQYLICINHFIQTTIIL